MHRLFAAALTVAIASLLVPAAASARPFAPDSFWNTPVAADAPLDARSDAYVGDLLRQLTQWAPYINTTHSSSTVYTVPADQPTVRVQLDSASAAADLRAAWERVPIPAGAVPGEGSDDHMVVHQPSTDTMWEFWRAVNQPDGWHASWGGRMTNVSTNPGFYTNPTHWGSSATSLPMLGGLIRLDELEAGRIDHALALVIPQPRKDVFSWPAQRTDGTLDSPDAIPEGTRFRLDPSLDLDTIEMAPIVRIVAEAAQRYGIVVRDKGGAIAFEAEDPTPTGTNPFTGPDGWFEGRGAAALMREFPWSRLQALPTKLRTAPPGSAYVANGVLTVASARNLLSDMRVEQSGDAVTVFDPGGLDAVDSKCTQVDPSRVSCVGVTSADLSGSYKADTIRMLAPLPATLSGNTSSDKLYGGSRGDTLNGDAGDDSLIPGTGPDRINGGDGNDTADYQSRTAPLALSLDGVANDGQAYEADNLGTDVESLIGGSGNDRIVGSAAPNGIWAQAGDDIVDGGAGGDWLNGGAGTDTADYSSRTKPLSLSLDAVWNDGEAGEGDGIGADFEWLVGGFGADTLVGGAGANHLDGRGGMDVIRGLGGADLITSRDLLIDDVACGSGTDEVVGDLIDLILKQECEILTLAGLSGDTTPPAPPSGPTATAGDAQVSLDWNDNGEGDLDGYNVYRSTTSGSGYSKLNGSLVGSSAFVDTTAVNGTTYYYVVTAVDTTGNESGRSGELSATPKASAPPLSGGFTLEATGYKVKGVQHAGLIWSGATSTSVDVYRNGTRVATTGNDGAHTDNIGKSGNGRYTYKVCEAGTATCSAEVTISFK